MRDGGPDRRSPYLPSGYRLDETDPDEVVLRREDGSEVAAYSATGADPKKIEREGWEDHRERHRNAAASSQHALPSQKAFASETARPTST